MTKSTTSLSIYAATQAGVIHDLMRYLVDGKFLMETSDQVPTNKISFEDYILKDASVRTYEHTGGVEKYDYRTRYFGPLYGYTDFNFDKNVYLLIDKGTFSAASLFAASLKNLRKVTIIGEETGGCEAGTDSDFSIIKLPDTGLLLHLPYTWFAVSSKKPNSKRGIMPDITIPSPIPTGNGEDLVMKKVYELILKAK
jgi:C-terminal processing protease CtpA/Prc